MKKPSIGQTFLSNTCKVWDNENRNSDLSYADHDVKTSAHAAARRMLSFFARHVLLLDEKSFSVRSNMGGIAVSGEVTLHTNKFPGLDRGIYIQISQPYSGLQSVMIRGCDGPADYTGYGNNFTTVTNAFGSMADMQKFAETVRKIAACNNTNRYGKAPMVYSFVVQD